ncbi:endonuclease [Nitratireductor mangrovi]|uniref:Serine protease n=1 Tax=Nitratireductor mangrovi TaxID=2599600 RepID=A0A5B8L515_9HYPH|nr:DNA/RNA non-specific endonuclease [Nitratireductor mangrovi]QDZ03027.1 endonuclease [Nitratireductor mangrovi]
MAGQFRVSLRRLNDAASRWDAAKSERERSERAAREGKLDKIDTAERIAKHANRLRAQALREVSAMDAAERVVLPEGVQELIACDVVRKSDIKASFVERVIGSTEDFLSAEFLDLGSHASRAVARVATRMDGSLYYGTGFMVSPSLLITNEHVLEQAEWAEFSVAEFDYQRDRAGARKTVRRFRLEPDRLFLNDKDLDYALVAVAPVAEDGSPLAEHGFCPLVGLEGKILVTHPVNIVQHPQGRLKEVVIRENALSALPKAPNDRFAHYRADTEPGSSGSPVFNDRWEVVALHHSAVPDRNANGDILTKAGQVWTDNMPVSDIKWVGNEGIRISRIISHLKLRQGLGGEAGELLSGLLSRAESEEMGPVRPIEVEKPHAAAAVPIAMPALRGSATITIPLTISVSVGEAGGELVARPGPLFEEVRPEPDYGSRPGYRRDFLDIELPLPRVVDPRHGRVALADDGENELRYHHYSVVMNADRRLAYLSAVNYDAEAPFAQERGTDSWFLDPRLDDGEQADNAFYKHNPLDRGHLTRRVDAGWGYSEAEARKANDDTFHWTNCAPQHEVFNQSRKSQPKDLRLWGELENHVTHQARDGLKRLSVFNGPVFGADDRVHRGLLIPSAFWKVVAYHTRSGGLGAVGFVLHQSDLIDNLAAERFDVGRFDVRQVRIGRIEELTGIDFGPLRNVDPMAVAELGEVFARERRSDRPLKGPGDILF